MKKSIVKLLKKYDCIKSIDDESNFNDGYWLYLKNGYKFDIGTIIHEYTIKDLIKSLKNVKFEE